MKVLFEISLKLDRDLKTIFFGIPEGEEVDEMYGFRYRNYLIHAYIEKNSTEKYIDEYDDGRSVYFIAKIDNRIIGSVRLIRDYYLPTEKDCFKFEEPEILKIVIRDRRAEIGRLIIEKYSERAFLPRNLVMFGLMGVLINYAKNKHIEGGYAFIKNSLKSKLDYLKFPYHKIENYTLVYNNGVLKKYFFDQVNPAIPIVYLTDEIDLYINRILNNKFLFKTSQDKGRLILRFNFIWFLFRKFL